MRHIRVHRKTGFINLGKAPIKILDFRGKTFYDTTILKKRVKMFNLPSGKYTLISGNIIKSNVPKYHSLKPMPNKERHYPQKRLKLKFGNNPHKATIYHNKGVILFDRSLKQKPLYVIWFIYYHELGHFYYKTEWKADEFARQMMLRKGFNPSQISLASLQGLSKAQYKRKSKTVKSMLQ